MRKAKLSFIVLISAFVLTFLGALANAAPRSGKQEHGVQAAKKEAAQDSSVYRVSYKVNELENGKIINSRSYTVMAKAGNRVSADVGSRIPVAFQGKLDYQNVGMAFSCTIYPQEENLTVHSEFNMNTLAGKASTSPLLPPPVIRRLYLWDDAVATIGKPAFVGSIDDVVSNRRFVIEVTVTKAE